MQRQSRSSCSSCGISIKTFSRCPSSFVGLYGRGRPGGSGGGAPTFLGVEPGGLVVAAVVNGEETLYSSRLACPDCGISVPQLEPRSFSFNSSYGACPECHGLGSRYDLDPAKVIVDWSKPLLDGGLGPGSSSQNLMRSLHLVVQAYGFDLTTPFEKFPDKIQNLLLNGEPQRGGQRENKTGFLGILGHLKRNLEASTSDTYREYLLDFMSATECFACHGRRLRPESLAVKVNGMSIADFTGLPIARALEAARHIKLTGRELAIAGRIAHEISERLEFLDNVGLGYLSLGRSAATLEPARIDRRGPYPVDCSRLFYRLPPAL